MDWRIRELLVTESTNDDLKLAADAGEAEGLVIHALSQKMGRGRSGRKWESPPGNLYCSLLLRQNFDAQVIGHMSFVTALAIADTVRAFLPQSEITLKWPNDVLVLGKKISGILLELGEGYLVVGIGINVKFYPDNTLYPTTSLAAEGVALHVKDVLEKVLECFRLWYAIYRESGFKKIREAWLKEARRGDMTVRLPHETLRGSFMDINDQGFLCLKLEDGTEKLIATGDVFL